MLFLRLLMLNLKIKLKNRIMITEIKIAEYAIGGRGAWVTCTPSHKYAIDMQGVSAGFDNVLSKPPHLYNLHYV